MESVWSGASNVAMQTEVGSGSLLSGLLNPAWATLDASLHMLPNAALTPPAQISGVNSGGAHMDSTCGALRDPALASTLYGSAALKSGTATPSHPLTPLQSSMSLYPGTFSRLHSDSADLYSRVGSAAAMSAPLLDLNPTAPATFSHGGDVHAHVAAVVNGIHLHGQQDANDEEEDEEEEDDEEDQQDGRSIDLEQEDRATQAHSSAATAEPERSDNGVSDADDEDYCQSASESEAGQSDDDDGDASDDEGGLLSWVSDSQRSGSDPKDVLRRLLTEYADVPISNKLLWKAAYSIGARIQQHLTRQAARRVKLAHINSIDDVCALIEKSQRIVVLTGAGISVAAGIPDFRSRGGIYPRLKREFGLDSPEAMFDLEYFRANPKLFYSFARELWPGAHHPTLAHRFIAMLERKGKLLRNYTQNIDALESRAGIENVLQCHGSFASARCMSCRRQYHGMHIHREIMSQTVPLCLDCHPPGVAVESIEEVGEDGLDRSCKTFGVIKPEITFFGENLPESFRTCLQSDRSQADLVIVMGSSLKVQPVAGMLELFSPSTPMVLINREVVGHPDEFDVELCGLADEVCAHLTERLGWTLPDVDPSRDTFRQMHDGRSKNQTGDKESDAPATAESVDRDHTSPADASDPNLVLSPPAAAASTGAALPPRAASPTFVAPNRYLFAGACASASPDACSNSSDASSSSSSVSLSPEPIALTHADRHRVLPPVSPLASPALQLPSLDFKHDATHLAEAIIAPDVQSPEPPFAPKLHAHHTQTHEAATPLAHALHFAAAGKRKAECTESDSISNGASAAKLADGAAHSAATAAAAAATAVALTDKSLHLPPVKRRKVSVPESKEE